MLEEKGDKSEQIDVPTALAVFRCPIVDGIVYPDGRIRKMLVQWAGRKLGRFEFTVRPGEWTTLGELRDRLEWTGVIPVTEARDVARDLRVVGGEGGLGDEGFVALTRLSTGQLLWLAFFSESNPFEVVELAGSHAMAKTNLGTWWRFPLEAPYMVTVE